MEHLTVLRYMESLSLPSNMRLGGKHLQEIKFSVQRRGVNYEGKTLILAAA
jgi:hypothetical protein